MKKTIRIINTLIITLGCAFFLLACYDTFDFRDLKKSEGGEGTFRLIIGSEGASRTIMPTPVKDDVDTYTLVFTRTDAIGTATQNWTAPKTSGDITLAMGTWDLTITAKVSTKEVAKGSATGIVISSTTPPKSVTLEPITTGTGTGTFSWDIDFSSVTVTDATMTFTPVVGGAAIGPIDIKVRPTSTEDLVVGQYRVVFNLNDSTGNAGMVQALHIYENMTSGPFHYEFTAAHFTVNASFVAVTNITGIPTTGTKGTEITLNGTVEPGTATNQTISWAVKSSDDTLASITGGNKVTPSEPGTLVVTATIANGIAAGTDYTQDFTIAISGTVATPTATPAAGSTVNSGATVVLATTTPGADIWYTTDDSTPSENGATSTKYTAAIPITAPTIKAIAVKTNCTDSAILTATYTVNVTFNSVTANGSATTTATTQLTLTFSAAISGLSAADIGLSNTSIVKGTLSAASGSGPVTYTLPISGFTAQETLTVTVTKTDYNITPSRTVDIFYPTGSATITIDFAELEDEDLDIGTIALSTSNSSETITLTTPGQYTSINWYVNNGSLKTGSGSPIILNKSDYSNGTYVLTVEVVKDGNTYTNTIDFTVGP